MNSCSMRNLRTFLAFVATTLVLAATLVALSSYGNDAEDHGDSDFYRYDETESSLPTIYFVTPTYPRPEQLPDMTRLANTLVQVQNLHWLVADDTKKPTLNIIKMLNTSNISYTYLTAPKPNTHGRGVSGRRAAVRWLQENYVQDGVMYFGDDDNTYDLRLFDEMRYTKKVAMWPVGLVTRLGMSSPVVKEGKIIDFYDGWQHGRKFPVDMAGFAVGIRFLFNEAKAINIPYSTGRIETTFLEGLGITKDDIEIKAENCTKIYVWHTQTKENPKIRGKYYKKLKKENTNLAKLAEYLV